VVAASGDADLVADNPDLLYEAYYDAFSSDLPRDVERDLNQQ
jgi:hypothetical protein